MDNAGFVSGNKRTRYLDRDLYTFTQLHRFARQAFAQCLAFDQFTGDVMS